MSKAKWGAIATVFLIVAMVALLMLTSGCQLFGPSVETARKVAEERQAETDKAMAAYTQAAKDLQDILAKYDAAVSSGDTTAAQALLIAAKEAAARYQNAKDVADSTRQMFNAAAADFKQAQSTSDYVGTVFGWLFAGLGSIFGAGGLMKSARAKEALGGVTKALEKVKDADGDVWPSAKADMQATLSTGALKLIDSVRP